MDLITEFLKETVVVPYYFFILLSVIEFSKSSIYIIFRTFLYFIFTFPPNKLFPYCLLFLNYLCTYTHIYLST